jgi:hypothetical protein
MKCVILQPSYIPWRGYFHQIYKADIFVFYDDVQYDKRGWRNRNRIKSSQGTHWLTIPVLNKGAQSENIPISKVRINWDEPWNQKHWKTIQLSYGKCPFFHEYSKPLEDLFNTRSEYLADFTIATTIHIARVLNITHTQYVRSSSLSVQGQKTDRLIAILNKVGADHYISGPSARDYIEEDKFRKNHIRLEYMDYNYPEYPQPYPPYDPQVTILDLLFSVGSDSLKYIIGACQLPPAKIGGL